MNQYKGRWNATEIEFLEINWKWKSASQIGNMINKSRNSVCGMAHRLKLQGRLTDGPAKHFLITPWKPPPKRAPKPKPVKVLVVSMDYAPPPPPEPEPARDRLPSLVELLDHECKWPLGDPMREGFGFCARARVAGAPYCPSHCKMAYHHSEGRYR